MKKNLFRTAAACLVTAALTCLASCGDPSAAEGPVTLISKTSGSLVMAVNTWDGGANLQCATTFEDTAVSAGDKINITLKGTPDADLEGMQVVMIDSTSWTAMTDYVAFSADPVKDTAFEETFSLEIKEDGTINTISFCTKVQDDSSSLTPVNIAVTLFTVVLGDGEAEIVDHGLLSTSVDLGTSWGKAAQVPASSLTDATEGSVLTVTTSASAESADYYQIALKSMDSTWSALSMEGTLTGGTAGEGDSLGCVFLASAAATVKYTLSADDAAAIKENGLAVGGYGVTVDSITLTAAE